MSAGHQFQKWASVGTAVAAVLAAACAENTGSTEPALRPMSTRPAFNVMQTVAGEVYVCPVGPAGSYAYTVSAAVNPAWSTGGYSGTFSATDIATAQGNQTLIASPVYAAGSCTLVFKINASLNFNRGDGVLIDALRNVTIQQTGAPAGTQLDKIVTTLASDPDVTTYAPATTVTVSLNDFHGAVAAFWNSTLSSGCTRTIGYWKTHAGLGKGNQGDQVSAKLPIWLGTSGGAKSVQVTTNVQAVAILGYADASSNGINKLQGQLLGAKLNMASGANDPTIAAVISAADAFLAANTAADWNSLTASQQAYVLDLKSNLDGWNNGLVGPGHCN